MKEPTLTCKGLLHKLFYTPFVLNIATYVALRQQKSVAFFSLEMSEEQLTQRILCAEAGIDSGRMQTGTLEDEDWDRMIKAGDRLSQAQLHIDDTASISVMELRTKARRLKAEQGLDLIIIDYLQLMQGKAGDHRDNRQQEISGISRSLKALARELKIPVVALSQLSRSVESRPVKKPIMSDLRECSRRVKFAKLRRSKNANSGRLKFANLSQSKRANHKISTAQIGCSGYG